MADNSWANLRVSREEYEASLRDSVNAYYEHAMNDPSMSQDEAIQSTAEMAENYHNAMDDFDAAAAENSNGNEGIDGGDDGGIDGGDGGIE